MSKLKPCPINRYRGRVQTDVDWADIEACQNRAPDQRISQLETQLGDESRRANAMAHLEAAATAENVKLREQIDRLVETLKRIRAIGRGEDQVADDDTEGLGVVADIADAALAEYTGTEPGKGEV